MVEEAEGLRVLTNNRGLNLPGWAMRVVHSLRVLTNNRGLNPL